MRSSPFAGRGHAAAWLALTWLVAAAPARGDDLDAVRRRGTLRVLVVRVDGLNEFFRLGAGPQPGFDREVLEGFARLHSLRLEPVAVAGWDELIPALGARRGDLIAGRFTVTEARRKLIAFTHEVFPTRPVVVTRKPTARITALEALRAARVGTVRGSSLAEAVAGAGVPPAHVDDGIPPGGLPAALSKGRVTAVVLGVENAITAQRDDPSLELGLFLGPPGSLAYGLRHEDAALRGALDVYIDTLRASDTWSQLVVKYFGAQAPEILQLARRDER